MNRPLRIDLQELGSAFEDASWEHEYYLDLQTGEILLLSELMNEAKDLREQIEADPDRYAPIPRPDPQAEYRTMEAFIETVADPLPGCPHPRAGPPVAGSPRNPVEGGRRGIGP